MQPMSFDDPAPPAVLADFDWPMFGLLDDVRPALAEARKNSRVAALATVYAVEGGAPVALTSGEGLEWTPAALREDVAFVGADPRRPTAVGVVALDGGKRRTLAGQEPPADYAGADFVVQGQVNVVPIPKRQERIEIQWTVKTGSGDERGRVVQLNEIPAGTLDRYWGDVAVVVAAEASNVINDVILRQAGHDPNEARQPASKP